MVTVELFVDHWLGYSRKKNKQGGVEAFLFWKSPGFFYFFTLPLKIPDKIKLKQILVTLENFSCYFFDTTKVSISSPRIPSSLLRLVVFLEPIFSIAHLTPASWLPFYLPACQLRRLLRASFAPALWWNFCMVANSVYLSWFLLLIFDDKLTDFIPRSLEVLRWKPQLEVGQCTLATRYLSRDAVI